MHNVDRGKALKRLVVALVVSLVVFSSLIGCTGGGATASSANKALTVFAGVAQKPALEETARAFEQETGIKVELHLGGSGTMLSQMKLSRQGDLYIPASPDFMTQAEREGLVDAKSIRIVAYLIPAILVPRGNPENIRALPDLARPGLTLAIANPQSVSAGLYAVEILERNGLAKAVQKNIVTYAESAEKLATILVLRKVDSVIGWSVLAKWHPQDMEAVYLSPEQIPRIAYYSAAVTTYSSDEKSAKRFLDFLTLPQAKAIYAKWGYITTEAEARKFAPQAQIGGEYHLPKDFSP